MIIFFQSASGRLCCSGGQQDVTAVCTGRMSYCESVSLLLAGLSFLGGGRQEGHLWLAAGRLLLSSFRCWIQSFSVSAWTHVWVESSSTHLVRELNSNTADVTDLLSINSYWSPYTYWTHVMIKHLVKGRVFSPNTQCLKWVQMKDHHRLYVYLFGDQIRTKRRFFSFLFFYERGIGSFLI